MRATRIHRAHAQAASASRTTARATRRGPSRLAALLLALTFGVGAAPWLGCGGGSDTGDRLEEAAEEITDEAEDAKESVEDEIDDAT